MPEPIPEELNRITGQIVDAAYHVHRALGPGLLESVYDVCLDNELRKRSMHVVRQVVLPIAYDGITLDAGLRLDLLVENAVVVEIKAVERLMPVHKAQVLTYLKLSGYRLGLLINFNEVIITDGIKRVAN